MVGDIILGVEEGKKRKRERVSGQRFAWADEEGNDDSNGNGYGDHGLMAQVLILSR